MIKLSKLLIPGVLAVGLVLGFGLSQWMAPDTAQSLSDSSTPGEREVLYWQAPMIPDFRSDKPGKSPMGMDLIPVYEDETGSQNGDTESTVYVKPGITQNLGIRTEKVLRGDLSRHIEAVGYIGYDENNITNVHLRTDGWIEDLAIRSEGQRVKKGDLLFKVYSPTLVNAQSEYLQSLKSNNAKLIEASHLRLQALNVSDDQIDEITAQRTIKQLVSFVSPQDGIVAALNVVEGTFVQPGTNVATLADLSTVWVLTDIFEDQAPWTRTGLAAEARLPFLPGAPRLGRVEFVYPTLDPDTRALRVRLKFDNLDEALKPNMFANVTIKAEPVNNALIIPRDAVIRSGNTERVIVSEEEGRFRAVEVLTGMESGDMVEILAGLTDDESVVVSGQFLIDSEASLTGSIRRLSGSDLQGSEEARRTFGHGVVNKIFPSQGIVNITHDPIADLAWPEMTMDFEVAPDFSLTDIQVGSVIDFELQRTLEGSYLVVSIKPIAPQNDNLEQGQ